MENNFVIIILILFSVVYFFTFIACDVPYSITNEATYCTYFGKRFSSPEGNLVNCSWYSDNACCKRTEVTSVFGNMYPLYGASQECANQINYLMCYFCSAEQYRWYDTRLYVCVDFCTSVYEACKDAKYEGKKLGGSYVNGTAFCEGQKFEVVKDDRDCFDFDPTVFSAGVTAIPNILIISTLTILIYSIHFLVT